jgi:predicted dehydrogenase
MPSSRIVGPTRRQFLGACVAGGLGAPTLTAARAARVRGANEALRVAVVGLNGRGRDHLAGFRRVPGVRIAGLCDVDADVLAARLDACRKRGEDPVALRDVRELLDRGGCDAISVATPNHSHAWLGCEAAARGVHAYVEKPISHDVWQGRQLVALAAERRVVVATGSQCRSHVANQEAIAWLRGGGLGRIRLARGLCYKRRPSIGAAAAVAAPPAHVDYGLWLGPAAEAPVRRQQFHYDWHWQWAYGNGDLGNQGVHQVDLLRWGLGVDALPRAVVSFGGRFGYRDDGETPNSQVVWCDYDAAPLVFEVRGLPARPGDEAMDTFLGARIGVVFHCEHGQLVLDGYEQGHARDLDGKVVRHFRGGGDHYANFVAAVRAGDPGLLTADARQGHLSAALCHLGNTSFRAGAAIGGEALGERLQAQPELHEAWQRLHEHLRRHDVPLPSDGGLVLGTLLRPAPDGADQPAPAMRPGFRVPTVVA